MSNKTKELNKRNLVKQIIPVFEEKNGIKVQTGTKTIWHQKPESIRQYANSHTQWRREMDKKPKPNSKRQKKLQAEREEQIKAAA